MDTKDKQIAELELALKNKANSKSSKRPNLNYGIDRHTPDAPKNKKKRKRKPSTGRVPDAQKYEKAVVLQTCWSGFRESTK